MFLFPEYEAVQLFIEPGHLGHTGMRRRRTFIFLRHRERCAYLFDLHSALDTISKEISKLVHTEPRDYLTESLHAHQLDLQSMAKKRKVEYQPDTPYFVQVRFECFLIPLSNGPQTISGRP